MTPVPDTHAAIVIRITNLNFMARARTQVYIDDHRVGTLATRRRAVSFNVFPGICSVMVQFANLKSQCLELSPTPGESVSIECGSRARSSLAQWAALLSLPVATVIALSGLPLTAIPIMIAYIVIPPYLLWKWASAGPGAVLYLKRPGESESPRSDAYRPRLTIRLIMMWIAAAAGLMAIAVYERRIHQMPNLWIILYQEFIGPGR